MSIQVGLTGRVQEVVQESNSAQAMGSGTLPVYATPAMVALMERAAWTAVAPCLAEGESTVGIKLDLQHTAPSVLGRTVWAEAEVVAVEGKKIIFQVTAQDDAGPIGQGIHHRFLIQNEPFLKKAQERTGA